METTAFAEQSSNIVSWSVLQYNYDYNYLLLPACHLDWSDHSLAGWLFSLICCSVNQQPLGVTSVGPGALVMHHQETLNCKYFVSIIAPLSCSLAPLRIAGFVVSMEWNISAAKLNMQPASYAVLNQQTITDNLGPCLEINTSIKEN